MTSIIAAMDEKYGIGRDSMIPWHGTAAGAMDLRYFREKTRGHIVLMGYNTWLSIGRKPLSGRINLVVSERHYDEVTAHARGIYGALSMAEIEESHDRYCRERNTKPAPLHAFRTLDDAVAYGCRLENMAAEGCYPELTCFIIGGQRIYREYLQNYRPSQSYINIIPGEYGCDTFFPHELLPPAGRDTHVSYKYVKAESWPYADIVEFRHYVTSNPDEECYLANFNLLLQNGSHKRDRTGVGTISYFSPPDLQFSLLDDVLPVLTTKRVAFKTLAKELLWFISGSTDSKVLESQGVNIWRGNTSRQFLDSRGLTHYPEGELGPGYGFQWRRCGEVYEPPEPSTTPVGAARPPEPSTTPVGAARPPARPPVDQLKELIRLLHEDPDSRRMIMTAWNPVDLPKMALPPCHILLQLWTRMDQEGQRYLSGKLYQRSADSFLGVPFNISSYALLLHILARITGMKAERLICTYGDYHIYNNHIEQVRKQSSRKPRPSPRIKFSERVQNGFDIDQLTLDDFQLLGYLPHNGIMATMAV
jgi:thymidylate synthase/dihydrofolate reductase